jgi:hypothetical protein
VIEGPEEDMIWSAYNGGGDDETVEADDEMEAESIQFSTQTPNISSLPR